MHFGTALSGLDKISKSKIRPWKIKRRMIPIDSTPFRDIFDRNLERNETCNSVPASQVPYLRVTIAKHPIQTVNNVRLSSSPKIFRTVMWRSADDNWLISSDFLFRHYTTAHAQISPSPCDLRRFLIWEPLPAGSLISKGIWQGPFWQPFDSSCFPRATLVSPVSARDSFTYRNFNAM